MRTVKKPDVRKNEILDIAQSLFAKKGYQQTTVDDILKAAKIAKGTFYYYYKSKEEVLDAVISRAKEREMALHERVIDNEQYNIYQKLLIVLLGQSAESEPGETREPEAGEPAPGAGAPPSFSDNELKYRELTQSVKSLTPVLARIIQKGTEEGAMRTLYPEETAALLTASASIIFDADFFAEGDAFDPQNRVRAFFHIMEQSLGINEGRLLQTMATI